MPEASLRRHGLSRKQIYSRKTLPNPWGIPRLRLGATQLGVSILHPTTRIISSSSHRAPASGASFSNSQNVYARMASKHHSSPRLDPEPSRSVQLLNDTDMGDVAHCHLPAGGIISIPVHRRQGPIPPSEPLIILPDPNLWFWPYG